MKLKLRKNSRPYQLLKYLALGSGILIFSTTIPINTAQIIKITIKGYIKKKRFERHQFLKDIKNLQRRELINYYESDDGKIKIILNKKGKEKMLEYKIDEMKLKIPKHWDHKWRIVMFDIPHCNKNARDAFRKKLLNFGFYSLQKSVFITPYPCEDEIDFIASFFNIRSNIVMFEVGRFDGEDKLKYHFSL